MLHGLVPSNPWRTLVYEALLALESRVNQFEFLPEAGVGHCFTDGSCSNPTDEEDSLAAWAVIQPGRGTISCGPLVGIQQNVARAEITAVLSATQWGQSHWGSVHIWSDSQNVVDHYRQLLQGTASPTDFEHSDLWEQIAFSLSHTSATFLIHKVPGHDDLAHCDSPFEEWCLAGNRQADRQAGIANAQRPLYFERVWSGYQAFRQTWKSRVKDQIRFQSAVAQQEVQDIPEPEAECDLEEELVQPIFSSEPNQALIAAQFESSFGRELPFSPNHDADFRHICVQLQSRIHFTDSSASRMRNVSLLEIYVMFPGLVTRPVSFEYRRS